MMSEELKMKRDGENRTRDESDLHTQYRSDDAVAYTLEHVDVRPFYNKVSTMSLLFAE